jgi:hypothetical protein
LTSCGEEKCVLDILLVTFSPKPEGVRGREKHKQHNAKKEKKKKR